MTTRRSNRNGGKSREAEKPGKSTYQLRNRATLQVPQRFAYLCHKFPVEPKSYNKIVRVPKKESWIKAMDDEINSHWKDGTWELVKPKQNMNLLSSRWVYSIKTKSDGEVDRFKARLIRGFEQIYGVDYSETFSPVVRYDTIRLLLWLAAADNLIVSQFVGQPS